MFLEPSRRTQAGRACSYNHDVATEILFAAQRRVFAFAINSVDLLMALIAGRKRRGSPAAASIESRVRPLGVSLAGTGKGQSQEYGSCSQKYSSQEVTPRIHLELVR